MRPFERFKKLFTDEQNTLATVSKHDNLLRPLFLMLVAALIAIVSILVIDLVFDGAKLGPFGDFFGGVLNPILTFLTFFGLIATIVIQRMELRLAREEYEKTATALSTQATENTFFNALDLHHKIVDGLKFDPLLFPESPIERSRKLAGLLKAERPPAFGREVFGAVVLEIQNRASTPSETHHQYKFLQDRYNHVLGHYFRNLYQALKLIDSYADSALSNQEKEKYTSILRAQLSSNELALLFLNCLEGMVDQGEFRNLVIRYKMLEHAPIQLTEGVYTATDRNIAIADSNIISQYLRESRVSPKIAVVGRGAFGTNPVALPKHDT